MKTVGYSQEKSPPTIRFQANRKCFFFLDLALAISHELGRSTGNGQLARLLNLGLESDLVAVAPHLGDERLAGDDRAGEAHLDVLEGAESGTIVSFLCLL
jgi:hypothetical protein